MSVTTTYKCDLCGDIIESSTMGYKKYIKSSVFVTSDGRYPLVNSIHVCKKCENKINKEDLRQVKKLITVSDNE